MTVFYTAYQGRDFKKSAMSRHFFFSEGARSIIGRTPQEVILTDARNMRIGQKTSVVTCIGISSYPYYCNTQPSDSWWIASFKLVRAS